MASLTSEESSCLNFFLEIGAFRACLRSFSVLQVEKGVYP